MPYGLGIACEVGWLGYEATRIVSVPPERRRRMTELDPTDEQGRWNAHHEGVAGLPRTKLEGQLAAPSRGAGA